MLTIPLFKRCSKCGQEYPFTLQFFCRDSHSRFGLRSDCKECTRRDSRQYMAKNREQNKQQCKTWYANNQDKVKAYRERNKPVRREKRKPMEKRYRERHRVERVAYNREYRNAHREWARKCRRDWCRLNPEKAKANMHRRLARKRNAPGSHTADDLRALYAEQCGYCAYCGIALHDKYHVDHVQPLSRGGSNAPDNLLLTCQSCNLSKGSKTYAEWKAVRGW